MVQITEKRVFWLFVWIINILEPIIVGKYYSYNPQSSAIVMFIAIVITYYLLINHYIIWYKTKFRNLFWKILWFILMIPFPFRISLIGPFLFYLIVIELKRTLDTRKIGTDT